MKHHGGYRFEGVINGVRFEVLIKRRQCDEDDDHSDVEPAQDNDCVKCACKPNGYKFLAEGRGANLKGTTNPVPVTLSIGNDIGTTEIYAEFE